MFPICAEKGSHGSNDERQCPSPREDKRNYSMVMTVVTCFSISCVERKYLGSFPGVATRVSKEFGLYRGLMARYESR
jgi:hypothetical protein